MTSAMPQPTLDVEPGVATTRARQTTTKRMRDERLGSSTEDVNSATVWSPSAWTDAPNNWCVAPHLFPRAVSVASTSVGSTEPGPCRSALRLYGDHAWTFSRGFISP